MNVTRDNFEAVYPIFKEKLNTCLFYSFDEEMTGIIDQNMRIKYDDTDEIRYNKMIAIATRYTIIQFGICLFHQDSSNDNTIIATSYNFYIFPHSAYNLDMTISTSAIDFLRKNNMDFNEWLTKGINYCDEKGEITAKTKYYPDGDGSSTANTATASAPIAPATVTATNTTTTPSTEATATTAATTVAPSSTTTKKYIVLTKDSDIEFIEAQMARIQLLLDPSTATITTTASTENDDSDVMIVLPDTNAFLRRVLYEQIEARFNTRVMVKKNEANKLCVYKMEGVDEEELKMKMKQQADKDFFNALGFRNVFNLLSSTKKPIVGHNCFFDLLFMIRWLDTTLPPTFEAFRCRLHTLFPSVYDTKFLAASGVVGESLEYSSLEQCYDYYNKINSINTTTSRGSDNSSSNDQDGGKDGDNIDDVVEKKVVTIVNSLQDGVTAQFHNAGYDAFITGSIFAKQFFILQHKLASSSTSNITINDTINIQATSSSSPAILLLDNTDITIHCINKLFLMRSFFHLILNPSQSSLEYKYQHQGVMIRISNFDAILTNNTFIQQLLQQASYTSSEYYINWIDNLSLYIHFMTTEKYVSIHWPDTWIIEKFVDYFKTIYQHSLIADDKSDEDRLFAIITNDNDNNNNDLGDNVTKANNIDDSKVVIKEDDDDEPENKKRKVNTNICSVV